MFRSIYLINPSQKSAAASLTKPIKLLKLIKRGDIYLSLSVPKCGYIFGSTIHANFGFLNDSPSPTMNVKLSLLEEIEYRGMKADRKTDDFSMCHTVTIKGAANKTSVSLDIIEPFKPSRLPLCSLIKVQHYLRLSASIHSEAKDFQISVPIYLAKNETAVDLESERDDYYYCSPIAFPPSVPPAYALKD